MAISFVFRCKPIPSTYLLNFLVYCHFPSALRTGMISTVLSSHGFRSWVKGECTSSSRSTARLYHYCCTVNGAVSISRLFMGFYLNHSFTSCPPDLTGTLHLCFRWLSYTVHARYSLAAVTSRALFGVTFCSADEITDDRSEQRPTAHSIIHLLLTICHLRFLTMTEIIHFHRMCRELHALHSSYFTLHRCFTTL